MPSLFLSLLLDLHCGALKAGVVLDSVNLYLTAPENPHRWMWLVTHCIPRLSAKLAVTVKTVQVKVHTWGPSVYCTSGFFSLHHRQRKWFTVYKVTSVVSEVLHWRSSTSSNKPDWCQEEKVKRLSAAQKDRSKAIGQNEWKHLCRAVVLYYVSIWVFFISFLIQDAMWNRKAAIKLKKLNRCCPSGDISVSALRPQLCVSPIHYWNTGYIYLIFCCSALMSSPGLCKNTL